MTVFFIGFLYFEIDTCFIDIYDLNQQNEKVKWISVLDSFPFYVAIFDHTK